MNHSLFRDRRMEVQKQKWGVFFLPGIILLFSPIYKVPDLPHRFRLQSKAFPRATLTAGSIKEKISMWSLGSRAWFSLSLFLISPWIFIISGFEDFSLKSRILVSPGHAGLHGQDESCPPPLPNPVQVARSPTSSADCWAPRGLETTLPAPVCGLSDCLLCISKAAGVF